VGAVGVGAARTTGNGGAAGHVLVLVVIAVGALADGLVAVDTVGECGNVNAGTASVQRAAARETAFLLWCPVSSDPA
jgi:hypothetical protein